ncbi:hypothetical protein NONO_c18020 [Nocardia nova SH22a]|uniref:Minor tail protein n=1 Tax=Nocardia nova SH22a TaxID=1415166 RepID=W5TBK9_9NOCA|nr:hypothetical protein [Nocardia nova]AHH16602.1 hypothetical protein NONO_c18020 [Nocardia nova SH22a]
MADLPPLRYGKVVGRFLANTADGPDINENPEFPPLTGTVKFTAGAPKILVYEAEPDPATVVQLPAYYIASLDEFGYLTWRDQHGIRLVAPTAEVNPAGWTWRVDFDLSFEGSKVAIAPFSFEVPEYIPGPDPDDPDEGSEGLVDLTKVSPVPASNGEAVVRGLSVVDVDLVGDALVFVLDNGDHLDPVTVPQIAAATESADAAATSATDAESARDAAQAAVDSFGLHIGTATTGAPGDPVEVTVTGGPDFELNFVVPQGEQGPQGPPAPDATSSVKGIVALPGVVPGELGGTAAHPAVTGWADKSDVGHTHTSTDITDATDIGLDVLTAATQTAARAAIGAGTSNLTLGTSGTTAAAGNDSRLGDTRTPTAGTSPYDMHIVVCSKDTVRAASGSGDFPFGLKLQRAVTVDSITLRANTADASGNLVVELRKNGSAVSGTSTTVAAANQVAGGTPNTSGPWSFAAGDILLPYITGVGTTPGKGLIVELKARA